MLSLIAFLFVWSSNLEASELIVSSVGAYVDKFEVMMCEITGAKYAIALVNGTNALHLSLLLAGVEKDDEVLVQSLTFIATANAISYCNATPNFVDVDKETLGLSPLLLKEYLLFTFL